MSGGVSHAKVAEPLPASITLSDILDKTVAFVGTLTPQGVLTEANAPALEAADLTRDDVIGKPFWDCYWWNYDTASQDRLKQAVKTAAAGENVRHDATVRMAGDTRVVIDFQLLPHFDGQGNVTLLVASGVDITQRAQQEQALAAAHDSFHHLVTNAPFGIYAVDSQFRLALISAGSEKVFSGVDPLIGRDFEEILREIWHEPFATEAIGRFRKALETGEPYRSAREVQARRNIDDIEAYDWKIERVTLPDGKPGVVCYFYDLSEREYYEAALRESEAEIRRLADSMPQLVWTARPDGTVDYYNNRLSQYGQVDRDPDGKFHWEAMLHPDDVQPTHDAWSAALAEGVEYSVMHRVRMADGTLRWHLTRALPVRGDDGKIVRWYGTATDIQDLRGAEERLQISEERFRVTFENAPVGVAHIGHDGRWLRVNRHLCQISGYTEAELRRMRFQDVTHPDDLGKESASLSRIIAGEIDEYTMEKRYIRKDGSVIWIDLTVTCVRGEDGSIPYFIKIVEDITARKDAERRQQLLVDELNHRVKNSLAMIQSMASHTMRDAEGLEDFREKFLGRLRTIASAHQDLFSDQLGRARLDQIIITQMSSYGATPDDRLRLDGPDVIIDPETAHSLSMIIHELVTNASKYGALSADGGEVRVSWRLTGEQGRRSVNMDWTETGGPKVTMPTRSGFGTRLIKSALGHSRGGMAEINYRPDGLHASLTFPLEAHADE